MAVQAGYKISNRSGHYLCSTLFRLVKNSIDVCQDMEGTEGQICARIRRGRKSQSSWARYIVVVLYHKHD